MDKQNDNKQHEQYTRQYLEIVKEFLSNASKINRIKKVFKIIFFAIIMGALVVSLGLFVFLSIKFYLQMKKAAISENVNIDIEIILAYISLIIPSLCTVIVSLLELPKIIATYLFNQEEDKHMSDIIKNIQTYEVDMYRIKIQVEYEIMRELKKTGEAKEVEMEDYPQDSLPPTSSIE